MMSYPIARQVAFYSLGITSASELVKQYFPTMSDTTIEAIRRLRYNIQASLTSKSDIPTLRKFMAELTTYLLSNEKLFGKNQLENRNYYVHDFPMKFKEFLYRKDKDGNFVHKEILDLPFIKRISNGSKEGIKMKEISAKTSPQARKHFNEAFEYMYFSDDEETRQIAKDLVMYSYYAVGMNYGHSKVGNFITTSMLEAFPHFVEVLNEMNGSWSQADNTHINRFVDQFLLNHTALIPKVSVYGWSRHGKNLVATTYNYRLRQNKDKTGKYLDFIRDYKGNIYQKVAKIVNGIETDIEYAPIDSNKTSNRAVDYIPYYSYDRDDIFSDDLKGKGVISTVERKSKVKEYNKWKCNGVYDDMVTTSMGPKEISYIFKE